MQVDYNHRYAGKTILYDINIKKSLDSDDEKISEILKSRLPIENEKVAYKKNGTIVDVTVPEEIFRADGLAIIKHFVQTDLFKFVTSLTKVNFVETYENKQTPKPKSEEKPKSK